MASQRSRESKFLAGIQDFNLEHDSIVRHFVLEDHAARIGVSDPIVVAMKIIQGLYFANFTYRALRPAPHHPLYCSSAPASKFSSSIFIRPLSCATST